MFQCGENKLDKEKKRIYNQRAYQKNREKRLQHQKEYYRKHKKERQEYMKKWCIKNRDRNRKENRRVKLQVIFHYSNGKNCCACCGESHIEFLTVDHIKGRGREHRRKTASGISFYKWLRKNNFPDNLDLRILCYNCNCSLGHLGYCPHNKEREK